PHLYLLSFPTRRSSDLDSAERAWKALDEMPTVVQAGSKKIGRGISSNMSGYGVPGNAAACDIEIQQDGRVVISIGVCDIGGGQRDRKSTRLNSSHVSIS